MKIRPSYLWGLTLAWLWGCGETNKDTVDTDANETDSRSEESSPFAPTFTLRRHDPDKCDNGLTLLAVQGGEETFDHPHWSGFGYLAAIPMTADGDGEQIDPEWIFADFDGGAFSFVDLLPNGLILTMRGAEGGHEMTEIDPVASKTLSIYDDIMVNHYAVTLPDGNILAIWSEFQEHDIYGYDIDRDGKKEIRMENLRVITPDGKGVWDWSVFEHDPDAPVSEAYATLTEWWGNCNAVSFIPKPDWTEDTPLEGDIYLNCRLLNRLYDIQYPSGEIRWIMGEGGDFGEGFFYHSHDPQISFDLDEDGNRIATRILLYDNREAPPLGEADVCPPDETCPEGLTRYSRVVEVVADADLNAEIVWKWPSPSAPDFADYHFYSPIGGGVVRLENGNLLITNATEGGNPFLNEICRGRLLEITRDGSLTGAKVVWDVALNDYYGTYRAIRIPEEAAKKWHSHPIPAPPEDLK